MDATSNDIARRVMTMLQSIPIDDAAIAADRKRAETQKRLDRLLPFRGSCASEVFDLLVHDELKPTGSLVVMRRFMANPEARFVALLGNTGTGKTTAALWGLAVDGGRYVTAEQVRRAWASEHPESIEFRYTATRSRYLIVDDAGTEREAAGAEHSMFELVNARQGGRLKTVITGNTSVKDFVSRYGVRTAERIEQGGAMLDIDGNKIRRPMASRGQP